MLIWEFCSFIGSWNCKYFILSISISRCWYCSLSRLHFSLLLLFSLIKLFFSSIRESCCRSKHLWTNCIIWVLCLFLWLLRVIDNFAIFKITSSFMSYSWIYISNSLLSINLFILRYTRWYSFHIER